MAVAMVADVAEISARSVSLTLRGSLVRLGVHFQDISPRTRGMACFNTASYLGSDTIALTELVADGELT